VLEKFGAPQIVNDGVTIAKEIELEDHVENTGLSNSSSSLKTNDAAGDGTTTATVLACDGKEGCGGRVQTISLKRGIDKATHFLVDKIAEHARPVEDSKGAQVIDLIW